MEFDKPRVQLQADRQWFSMTEIRLSAEERQMSAPEYKFEKLTDTIYVCASSDHRFGTDAFLLADFSQYRQKDKVCDLGTGCGIIPLIMQKYRPPQVTYAVDIQEGAIEQA